MTANLAVTATDPPTLAVKVAGSVLLIDPPNVSWPRKDLIRSRTNPNRTIQVMCWRGIPSHRPEPPRLEKHWWNPDTLGWTALAVVHVQAGASAILASDIEVLA